MHNVMGNVLPSDDSVKCVTFKQHSPAWEAKVTVVVVGEMVHLPLPVNSYVLSSHCWGPVVVSPCTGHDVSDIIFAVYLIYLVRSRLCRVRVGVEGFKLQARQGTRSAIHLYKSS